jgi:hypothetical protein
MILSTIRKNLSPAHRDLMDELYNSESNARDGALAWRLNGAAVGHG